MKDLTELRQQIDAIDKGIIELLAARFEITKKVGVYKKEHHLPPQDHTRESEQLSKIGQLAEEQGLPPLLAQRIFRLTIDEVVMHHKKLWEDR